MILHTENIAGNAYIACEKITRWGLVEELFCLNSDGDHTIAVFKISGSFDIHHHIMTHGGR